MATSVSGVTGAAAGTTAAGKGISAMDGMDFLKLLISELSNQDPFEPMKNKEILEQLSAIRSLESNMTMSANFKTLLGHQELASATTLIGRMVRGVDTRGTLIEGRVERIILDASGIRLQIGDREMTLGGVQQIFNEEEAGAAG